MICQYLKHLRCLLGRWKKDKGMKFWPMLSYPDVFNFVMFCTCKLGSKDLSDDENIKVYSYYKSWWLHPLQYLIFQEVNLVLSEASKGSILQTLDNIWKDMKNKDLSLVMYGWQGPIEYLKYYRGERNIVYLKYIYSYLYLDYKFRSSTVPDRQ